MKTKVFAFELTPCSQRHSIDNLCYPVKNHSLNQRVTFLLIVYYKPQSPKIACVKTSAQAGTDTVKRLSQHSSSRKLTTVSFMENSQVQQSVKHDNYLWDKNTSRAS